MSARYTPGSGEDMGVLVKAPPFTDQRRVQAPTVSGSSALTETVTGSPAPGATGRWDRSE